MGGKSPYQQFQPRLSELRGLKREISRSVMRETEPYAAIMVLLELFGSTKGEFWWIGCSTMELHDQLTVALRRCKLNYRTQRAKMAKTVVFTVYFQPLPTTFETFRPIDSRVKAAVLEKWAAYTKNPSADRWVVINQRQNDTLSYCEPRPMRVIERPITWLDKIRPGFLLNAGT